MPKKSQVQGCRQDKAANKEVLFRWEQEVCERVGKRRESSNLTSRGNIRICELCRFVMRLFCHRLWWCTSKWTWHKKARKFKPQKQQALKPQSLSSLRIGNKWPMRRICMGGSIFCSLWILFRWEWQKIWSRLFTGSKNTLSSEKPFMHQAKEANFLPTYH